MSATQIQAVKTAATKARSRPSPTAYPTCAGGFRAPVAANSFARPSPLRFLQDSFEDSVEGNKVTLPFPAIADRSSLIYQDGEGNLGDFTIIALKVACDERLPIVQAVLLAKAAYSLRAFRFLERDSDEVYA